MNRIESGFAQSSLLKHVRAHKIIVHSFESDDVVTLRSGGGEKNETIKLGRPLSKKEHGLITTHNNAKGKGRKERTNCQLPPDLNFSASAT